MSQSLLLQYIQKVGKSFKVDIGAAIPDRGAYCCGFKSADGARIYATIFLRTGSYSLRFSTSPDIVPSGIFKRA